VVFPPCGVWLGLCVGRVDPALVFIRWQLGVISPRVSARQTRAGRFLATAGAPQLHSPAPPQQTRRQARRPADNKRSSKPSYRVRIFCTRPVQHMQRPSTAWPSGASAWSHRHRAILHAALGRPTVVLALRSHSHASTALNLVTHGKSKIPPLEVISTGCRQRVMNHPPLGYAAVVAKQVRKRDNKLVACGVAGTFVGRSPDVVGSYLIWVPAHGKIVATADVRFDDESFPWVSESNCHPPSILAANRLRLAAAHALRGEPLPAPQALLWASSSNAAPTPPSGRPPVLHLFSRHPHPEDLASHLNLHGFRCVGPRPSHRSQPRHHRRRGPLLAHSRHHRPQLQRGRDE